MADNDRDPHNRRQGVGPRQSSQSQFWETQRGRHGEVTSDQRLRPEYYYETWNQDVGHTTELGESCYQQSLDAVADRCFSPMTQEAFLLGINNPPYHDYQSETVAPNLGDFNPEPGYGMEVLDSMVVQNTASDRSGLYASRDPRYLGQIVPRMSLDPRDEPWTPHRPISTTQAPEYHYPNPEWGQQGHSDTTPSLVYTDWSYGMIENSTSSILSQNLSNNNNMADSLFTVCPEQQQDSPRRSMSPDNLDLNSFIFQVERSATPQSNPNSHFQHELNRLTLPMQRSGSSASSCASEASSLRSDDPDVLYCGEPSCGASFSGKYRKGNLARHNRVVHRRLQPYVCQSPACGKSFRRQDARLKHYRRHHPTLAANNPYLPRSPVTRSPSANQDDDL